MKSIIVSITIPEKDLEKIDEAKWIEKQNRSNFMRDAAKIKAEEVIKEKGK